MHCLTQGKGAARLPANAAPSIANPFTQAGEGPQYIPEVELLEGLQAQLAPHGLAVAVGADGFILSGCGAVLLAPDARSVRLLARQLREGGRG